MDMYCRANTVHRSDTNLDDNVKRRMKRRVRENQSSLLRVKMPRKEFSLVPDPHGETTQASGICLIQYYEFECAPTVVKN